MSIMDEGIIDFIGLEKNEKKLIFSISDHLNWGGESDDVHLLILENKINDYLRFIEGDEVNEHFKPEDYDKIMIRVIAKYPFSADCMEFLHMTKQVINAASFGFEWEVSSIEDESD